MSAPPFRRTFRQELLPEVAATHVREMIISGEVRAGEFLRMDQIAETLGVSNTPVREGLLLLRNEGYVRLVPRRGFKVARFTRQDVHDLFWVQAHLAGELAARAAQRITPERLRRLEALLEGYDQAATAGDDQRIADLGHAFHREINLAADSDRLALLLGSAVKQLPNRFYAEIEGMVADSHTAHPQILDAVAGGRAADARAIMEQHILERAELLAAAFDEPDRTDRAAGL